MTVALEDRFVEVTPEKVQLVVAPDVRVSTVATDLRVRHISVDDRFTVVDWEDRGPKARMGAIIHAVAAVAEAVAVSGVVVAERFATVAGPAVTATVDVLVGAVSVNEEIPGQTATVTVVAAAGVVAAIRNPTVFGVVSLATAVPLVGVVLAERNTNQWQ